MAKSKPKYIRVDTDLEQKVIKEAEKLNHNFSGMVNLIIKQHYVKS